MKVKNNIRFLIRLWILSVLFVAACITPQATQKSELTQTESVAVSKSLRDILKEKGLPYPPKNVRAVLNKAENRLDLMINKMLLKSYKVAVGANVDSNRLFEGDNATPEGLYKILLRQKSGKDRSLMLNYPTTRDMQSYKKALAGNRVPKDATSKSVKIASGVKIYAGDTSKPTAGSIAVSPDEFKEVYRVLKRGTPITIKRGEIVFAKNKEEGTELGKSGLKVAALNPKGSEIQKDLDLFSSWREKKTPDTERRGDLEKVEPITVSKEQEEGKPEAKVADLSQKAPAALSLKTLPPKVPEIAIAALVEPEKNEPVEQEGSEPFLSWIEKKSPVPEKTELAKSEPVTVSKDKEESKPDAQVAALSQKTPEMEIAAKTEPEKKEPLEQDESDPFSSWNEKKALPVVVETREEASAIKNMSEDLNMAMATSNKDNFKRDLESDKRFISQPENSLPVNSLAARILENTGLIGMETLSFNQPMFKITDKPVRDVGPKFSPDGKYVSFSRIDRVYNDVWVWEQDINRMRRVTLEREDIKDASFGDGTRFSYGGIWGSDAEKMLIISSFKGNYDIFLFDLAENKFVPITKDRAWDGNPAWSPDGDSMAFVSARTGNGDIWTKEIGRYFFSKPKQLTDNPGIDFGPVWSHDSKKVFYTSRQFDNYDIYVVDVDEGIPLRLTFTESADRYVSISPSGDKIAFFSDFNISIMDLSGIDFASIEVQTDPNGWRFKELPYDEAEKRTTLLIPDISIDIVENRGGREVNYKKKVQYIKALTSLEGPLWTSGGDRIVFVANKPLKPIYAIGLDNLLAKNNSNIYEIKTESEIHRDLNLSNDGKHLVFGTFRNDYSRFNNNISLVEFSNPPKQVRERTLIAKILPEFLVKEAKSWYQITNPPPQDVSFLSRGKTGLISGTGAIGVSGGR